MLSIGIILKLCDMGFAKSIVTLTAVGPDKSAWQKYIDSRGSSKTKGKNTGAQSGCWSVCLAVTRPTPPATGPLEWLLGRTKWNTPGKRGPKKNTSELLFGIHDEEGIVIRMPAAMKDTDQKKGESPDFFDCKS